MLAPPPPPPIEMISGEVWSSQDRPSVELEQTPTHFVEEPASAFAPFDGDALDTTLSDVFSLGRGTNHLKLHQGLSKFNVLSTSSQR